MTETTLFLPFPRTLNIRQWSDYLNRDLFPEETYIIENVRHERDFNEKVKKLHEVAKSKNYYIPKLTKLHGNCLFESLEYFNICEDKDYMRKGIAHLLLLFRDYKGLIKGDDNRTIEQLFNDTNDIENILCRDEDRAYKYNFTAMCQDLASDFSWTRLPTELIMIFMSKIFNIKFLVVSNLSDYVNVVTANDDSENPINILLGHIGETHYVPLMWKCGKPEEEIELYHQEYKTKFVQWAHMMEQSVNMIYKNTLNQEIINNESREKMRNTLSNSSDNADRTFVDISNKMQQTNSTHFVNYE